MSSSGGWAPAWIAPRPTAPPRSTAPERPCPPSRTSPVTPFGDDRGSCRRASHRVWPEAAIGPNLPTMPFVSGVNDLRPMTSDAVTSLGARPGRRTPLPPGPAGGPDADLGLARLAALGWTLDEALAAYQILVAAGLVAQGPTGTLVPEPPRVAIGRLIDQEAARLEARRRELEDAQAVIATYAKDHLRRPGLGVELRHAAGRAARGRGRCPRGGDPYDEWPDPALHQVHRDGAGARRAAGALGPGPGGPGPAAAHDLPGVVPAERQCARRHVGPGLGARGRGAAAHGEVPHAFTVFGEELVLACTEWGVVTDDLVAIRAPMLVRSFMASPRPPAPPPPPPPPPPPAAPGAAAPPHARDRARRCPVGRRRQGQGDRPARPPGRLRRQVQRRQQRRPHRGHRRREVRPAPAAVGHPHARLHPGHRQRRRGRPGVLFQEIDGLEHAAWTPAGCWSQPTRT